MFFVGRGMGICHYTTERSETMNLPEGTRVFLTTGEIFVLNNEMRTNRSCTIWDVHRFREEGILKGVKQHV